MTLLQINIDPADASLLVGDIAARLLINFVSLLLLIRGVYFKSQNRSDLYFTFFSFNIIIFFISYLLNKVDLSIGTAFGLFAVFSMLRYRTEGISIKDMSYLFLVIALGLISAVTKIKGLNYGVEYLFAAGISATILIMAYLLENSSLVKKETTRVVVYDNLELTKPEKRKELIEDIKAKTGITPHKISIERVNITKGTSEIKIFYYED
jgi:hypothetical protein